MFNNLIESGSHGRDLKRKGSFFIGTFLFYTVLLTAAGVGSIYAYNVRLDEQNDYELTLIRFPAATEKAEPQKPRAQPKSAATNSGGGKQQQVARIRDLVLDTPLPNRPVAPEGARVLARGTVYQFVERGEYFPPPGNIGGPGDGISRGLPGDKGLPRVTEEIEAPEVKVAKPTPEPPRAARRPRPRRFERPHRQGHLQARAALSAHRQTGAAGGRRRRPDRRRRAGPRRLREGVERPAAPAPRRRARRLPGTLHADAALRPARQNLGRHHLQLHPSVTDRPTPDGRVARPARQSRRAGRATRPRPFQARRTPRLTAQAAGRTSTVAAIPTAAAHGSGHAQQPCAE